MTLLNCDTGDPLGPSLRRLLTFHEGGTLELDDDGDHFTTQSAVQLLDPDDAVVGTACAASAGVRIE